MNTQELLEENNLAFVASKVSLEHYWQNDNISKAVFYKEKILKQRLLDIANKYKDVYDIDVRGRGLAYGFEIKNDKSMASDISKNAFKEGLIVETCGSESQVVKFLPPLLIEEELLEEGLKRFEIAVDKLIEERKEHLKGEY